MRFTLTAVAAGALLAACTTITEPQAPDTEIEEAVDATTEVAVEPANAAATDTDPYLWLEEVEGEAGIGLGQHPE